MEILHSGRFRCPQHASAVSPTWVHRTIDFELSWLGNRMDNDEVGVEGHRCATSLFRQRQAYTFLCSRRLDGPGGGESAGDMNSAIQTQRDELSWALVSARKISAKQIYFPAPSTQNQEYLVPEPLMRGGKPDKTVSFEMYPLRKLHAEPPGCQLSWLDIMCKL